MIVGETTDTLSCAVMLSLLFCLAGVLSVFSLQYLQLAKNFFLVCSSTVSQGARVSVYTYVSICIFAYLHLCLYINMSVSVLYLYCFNLSSYGGRLIQIMLSWEK